VRTLIIDPVGGISGDMLVGSLIHLGCPVEYLESILRALPIGEFTLEVTSRRIQGITALGLTFGCEDPCEHRSYAFIRDRILCALPGSVRERAERIFLALAEAEAHVHGVSVDEVHFHEVGALDSILDIAGIAAAIEHLGADEIYCRSIPLGTGTTRSMHGTIPLPAPATLKLLEGREVRFTGIASELTTPTGAAVISALAHKGDPPGRYTVMASGFGCGSRELPGWPNLCRSILCKPDHREHAEHLYLVETDVDDMNPEETEAALERILAAGALDAHLSPRIMKRGRPGFCLKAICPAESLDGVTESMLVHTTSIGVRFHPVERRVLERTSYTIDTPWGEVGVKESVLPDGSRRIKLEYRDLARIARERSMSVAAVRAALERMVLGGAGGEKSLCPEGGDK
jgi:uncharacterized protein (TIGR00299 family) protein